MLRQIVRSSGSRTLWPALAAALAGLALATAAQAHDPSKHGAGTAEALAPAGPAGAVEVRLEDIELVDRTGRPVKFRSEAMADRIVAIDFIYTSCTTVCPVLSALFAQVQDQLGPRLGKEVWLASISVDPVRDTPRRMAAEAEKFGAGPGWLWLTGRTDSVERVLTGLDAYAVAFEEHASVILIGDAKSGKWRRLFGFPAPEDIVAILDEFAAERGASKSAAHLGN